MGPKHGPAGVGLSPRWHSSAGLEDEAAVSGWGLEANAQEKRIGIDNLGSSPQGWAARPRWWLLLAAATATTRA